MKLIKSTLYFVKYSGPFEEYLYIKANTIEEAIVICKEYIKNKYCNDAPRYNIAEITLVSTKVIESSTKTVTIDV